jgi:hypothetical protein
MGKVSGSLLLFLGIVVLATIATPMKAHAFQYLQSPWGETAGVQVQLGMVNGGTAVVMDWKNRTTGECVRTYLGENNALLDDFNVQLTDSNDIFYESWNTFPQDLCGFGGLVKPAFGAHFLDVVGRGGNDYIQSGNDVCDSFIYGANGNLDSPNDQVDYLRDDRLNGYMDGASENDIMVTGARGLKMTAHVGVDCLSTYTRNASTFDCGDGWDFYNANFHPSTMISCEFASPQTNCPYEDSFAQPWPY